MDSLQVGGLTSYYQKVGKGPLLVLLHGWANTWEAWLPVIPGLSEHYTLIIPDLPGFGKSLGPANGWSTHHYALWLREFLERIRKQYPEKEWAIAGHSFGGKIAAYYCSQNFSPLPGKLILIDASGIPGKLTRKQRALKLMALATPPFLKTTMKDVIRRKLYKAFDADSDYLNANDAQRNTLKKVLTENLTPDLPNIEIPTLILWGRDDEATPLSAGETFNRMITGSEFKVFEAEHFPHHQHPERVIETIEDFLKKPIERETGLRAESGRKKKPKQPLTTLLAILQQAEYEWPRVQDWLSVQTGEVLLEPKKWTSKLKALELLTKLSSPLLGLRRALHLFSELIKIPQRIWFWLVILLAKFKLRLLQILGLKVVAIAGSYGKTSTKFILHHALKDLVPTLMTPDNINTPYGIARVILRELKPSQKLFIAELGEYYPGDILELTRFLRPAYKILTPVGYAHLERFGTQERLERGLLELLSGKKVLAFVHEDNAHLIEKYQVPSYCAFYGQSQISEASVSRAGTEFNVRVPDPARIFIPLLGKHNAVNVLPTLMLADQLGLNLTTVMGKLRTLPHIPHRLQPTLLEHNIFLLDNGYNSNPGSAKQALSVLSELEGSQKIVITPGFVEMGDTQEQENINFGEDLARVCNLVGIVTGTNEAALITGLTQAKFKRANIVLGDTELEVMNTLQPKIKPGAVILFENSITDVYKRVV